MTRGPRAAILRNVGGAARHRLFYVLVALGSSLGACDDAANAGYLTQSETVAIVREALATLVRPGFAAVGVTG